MSKGPKLLLIDGNNMAHRVYWTNKELSHQGRSTGLIYGFFKQLVSLHKHWEDYFRIIVWDGGYERRLRESEEAVKQGLIPSAYKATRHKNEEDMDADELQKLEDIHEQIAVVREGLKLTRCLQVRMEGVEADDILYSYAKHNLKWNGDSIIVSSDQDFYQALDDGIRIYDAMKKEIWTKERFTVEMGFDPELWVDAGAIMGEVGASKDNIHGVDGWGPVTAVKYVRKYGDVDAIIAALQEKKKRGKREETFLNSIPRLRLAKSLKAMDDIPDLPKPRVLRRLTKEELEKFFLKFGFASLLKDIWRLI